MLPRHPENTPPLITDTGFPGGAGVKNLPAVQETQVQSLDHGELLEEGIATHSNILAWRIPWTEEPDRLSPWGHKSVGHD